MPDFDNVPTWCLRRWCMCFGVLSAGLLLGPASVQGGQGDERSLVAAFSTPIWLPAEADLAHISSQIGLALGEEFKVSVDASAFAKHGRDVEAPLHVGVLRTVRQLMLYDLAERNIDFLLKDGTITFVPRCEAYRSLQTRAYFLQDMTPDVETFRVVVRGLYTMSEPDGWAQVGGPARIEADESLAMIAVHHTLSDHLRIRDVLGQ